MVTREFQYTQGTSNKFWHITLDGTKHTVQYGRIGTAGQSLTKEFGSEAEALKSYEGLVKTKLKEGYTEIGNAATVTSVAAPSTTALEPKEPKPAAKKTAPESAPEKPTVPANFEVKREINLDETDWLWATWRPRTVKTRPEPRPFDKEALLKQLSQLQVDYYGWNWRWDRLKLPESMTRQEAQFWLSAILDSTRQDNRYSTKGNEKVAELVKKLQKQTFSGEVQTFENFVKSFEKCNTYYLADEILLVLGNLYKPQELIKHILDSLALVNTGQYSYGVNFNYLIGRKSGAFRHYVLCYMTEVELEEARNLLRDRLDYLNWQQFGYFSSNVVEWQIASALGMHEEVSVLLKSVSSVNNATFKLQEIILGLNDPKLVEQYFRQFKLDLSAGYYGNEGNYIGPFLAQTELVALDIVRDSILIQTNVQQAEALMRDFMRVVAPEAAPFMLDLKSSKAAKLASQWLEQNPVESIAGLIPVAAGRDKLAEQAQDYLRVQARRGNREMLEKLLEQAAPEVAEKVRKAVLSEDETALPPLDEQNTPAWLTEALAKVKTGKLPLWASPALLPPLPLGQNILNDKQITQFLAALQTSSLDKPHPVIALLKQQPETRAALDGFGWALFQQWLGEGAASKDKWAMLAVGLLGDDRSVFKLAPLVKLWPGESQHQRAVTGLYCLRSIGTDTALMQINGIAQKAQFKAIKEHANKCIDEIATARSMSRAELEDRIVPDCDLDERGSTVFDFGPRKFKFALSSEMVPMLRDESGALKSDLPKPNSKDDPTLAEQAIERWKLIKKQVREVSKVQAERLEQAMISGRRWATTDFETLFMRHPLMVNLARMLVWGCYDKSGKPVASYRITEDSTLADCNDDDFELQGHTVGIIHPMHLKEDEREAWGQLLSDYQIIPPFPQLGRRVSRLEPGEEKLKEITRFASIKVPCMTLVGILARTGWTRGYVEDGGVYYEHSRQFPFAGVTAVVQYQGVAIGYYSGDWDDQSIEKCFFVPGSYSPDYYPKHEKLLPLGEVDPVVISEVLAVLNAIAAKGK
jgi:predicted DNA-binding WGR domain protein